MSDPITAAYAITPEWMLTIREFDGLELTPCAVVGFADEQDIVEPCEPEAAHFWTVYGHYRTGGLNAFEDFPDVTSARAFATRLLEAYPHLSEHGLSDHGGSL